MPHRNIERTACRPPCICVLFCPTVRIALQVYETGTDPSVDLLSGRSLTDAALSRLANELVVSFVYSHDVVSRLSLGSVRDLKNAALWLCHANDVPGGNGKEEGYAAVTTRARQWKAGSGSPDDADWVRATPFSQVV